MDLDIKDRQNGKKEYAWETLWAKKSIKLGNWLQVSNKGKEWSERKVGVEREILGLRSWIQSSS